MAPNRFGSCIAAVIIWMAPSATAMKVVFDDLPPPAPFTMQTHYLFYVVTASNATDLKQAEALAHIDAMIIPGARAQNPPVASTARVQVAILPLDEFDKMVDTTNFCNANGLKLRGDAESHAGKLAGPFTISLTTSKQEAWLSHSGVYALTIANCANLTDFKLSGAVSVKNPHGFLSAIDYNKANLYWGFFVVYLVVSLAWVFAAQRWCKQLSQVQKGIFAVSVLGTIECCLMGTLYHTSNQSDGFSQVFFLIASLVSGWKACELLRIAMQAEELLSGTEAAASGWASNCMLSVTFAAYMSADFNFRQVIRHRYEYAASMRDVLLNSAPSFLIGLVVLIWCHVALFRQRGASLEKGRIEEASLVTKSQLVLCLGTVGALIIWNVQLAEVRDTSSVGSWKSHYLISDGLPQIMFSLVLSLCTFVWWPSEATSGYVYEPQAQDEEGQPIGAIWNDDALDDDSPPDVDKVTAAAE